MVNSEILLLLPLLREYKFTFYNEKSKEIPYNSFKFDQL